MSPDTGLNNKKGIVLASVVIMAMLLSIIAVGILSINVSQVSTSQSVIDTIKAEQLAIGTFYKYHQSRLDNIIYVPSGEETILGGKTYTVTLTEEASSGPQGTAEINVTVDY